MKKLKLIIAFSFIAFSVLNYQSCKGDDDSTPNEICNDGIDNDGDGFTDCDDFDCDSDPNCNNEICDDGIDNDGDGFTDCEDFDCNSFSGC